ncbi:non-homologous end joining protein Ku [Streptomyces malaysiensis]|uniref:Non-homologous end joining protein Ku n=1 Tax=Streptomyces malaysiensis subsp. samsunensis TaxID=459658 RepID=A0A9X2M688_STRMQ|nr:Ku protein [Streptomyces samsunensis]MCQ8835821.1 Ku protein [Streptomyces samsunensis]
MPRPVWSGAVSFGLVTIPIKVMPATEDHSISFRQIHIADGGRIRYRKICEIEDRVLDPDEIGRAYEASRDQLVPISDQELDDLPLPTAKAIDVEAFIEAERIDPIRFGKPYYLQADGAVAAKPYVLLREALQRSDKIAVAKFAWHNRERLGALRVVGEAIVLQVLHWPDEVRAAEGVAPRAVDISDSEVEEAIALMDVIGGADISQYRDQYREAMEAVIEAKTEGVEPPHMEAPAEPKGKVVDLMSALQDSVRAAKKSRGEETDEAEVHEISGRRPAQKKAAKKTAAKKTSAGGKKTAAKKSSRKKPAS